MTNFEIKVVSDTVCPWCYVGKKRMEKGIEIFKAAHPDSRDTFSITWKAFQLSPDAPKIGIEKDQYLISRFGEERFKGMSQNLSRLGEAEGIHFSFGGKTGNTRDSHRLVVLAKSKSPEMASKLYDEICKGYFENEKDITSHEFLQEAGEKAGLDAAEVRDWLATDKGGAEVDEEVKQARSNFISGVPHFTIQDKYEFGGAQEPAAFATILTRIKQGV